MAQQEVPKISSDAVLVQSESLPTDAEHVKGYTFEDDKVDYDELFKCYTATGFQATNLGRAIGIVNGMVRSAFAHPIITINLSNIF